MNTPFTGRRITHIAFVVISTALSCAILSCAIVSRDTLAQTPSPNGAADLEIDGQPPSISEPLASPETVAPEEIEMDIHRGASTREEDLQQEQEQNVDQPDIPAGNDTPEQDTPDQLEIPW